MRLPRLDAETMTARQRELAERIAGRRGAVRGPFQVWLHSPELCDRVEALGAFARFESALPLRLREELTKAVEVLIANPPPRNPSRFRRIRRRLAERRKAAKDRKVRKIEVTSEDGETA